MHGSSGRFRTPPPPRQLIPIYNINLPNIGSGAFPHPQPHLPLDKIPDPHMLSMLYLKF